MELLGLLAQQLIKLLETVMPALDSDWWNSLVLEKLTNQQRTFASSLPRTLERLDLAALLRVADQNWYDIASECRFNREARNWLKEAQSIRNRWAHAPAEGLPDDVLLRDIDTIERLLAAFGADSLILDSVKKEKQTLINRLAVPAKATPNPIYKLGDLVHLKADFNKTGKIIAVLTGEAENRYQVFHDGNISTYYESQLERLDDEPDSSKLVFWQQLSKFAISNNTPIQLNPPAREQFYCDIRIGKSECYISLTVWTRRNEIGCQLYIPNKKTLFKELLSNKETIEEKLAIGELLWEEKQMHVAYWHYFRSISKTKTAKMLLNGI